MRPAGSTLPALTGEALPIEHATSQTQPRHVQFAPMAVSDLDTVVALEQSAYAHPWSRKHFADSLAAGHPALLLLGQPGPQEAAAVTRPDGLLLLGYWVAMRGVDEVHLLNITVAPAHQRQGWARCLLDALCLWARGQGAHCLWLEVRAGNAPAQALYQACGFQTVGQRKGYYPTGQFQREDALVMQLPLERPPTLPTAATSPTVGDLAA